MCIRDRALAHAFEQCPLCSQPYLLRSRELDADHESSPAYVLDDLRGRRGRTRARTHDRHRVHATEEDTAASTVDIARKHAQGPCLLYTSDAADDLTRVD